LDALKKAGVLTFGQITAKLAEGDASLLEIAGFGQSSLTAAKKKLRSLGFEIPEVLKSRKSEKAAEPEAGK